MSIKTNQDHINNAFSRLRISGLTVGATPEDNQLALERLVDMMYEWEGNNICVNYIFEEVPKGSSSSGVEPKFNEHIAICLASRMIDDFGKTSDPAATASLRRNASAKTSRVSSMTAKVNNSRYPDRQPMGSGNTFRWNRWIRYNRQPPNPVISCDTEQLQLNSKGAYVADFSDFLDRNGGTISSFEIIASGGLELSNQALSSDSKSITYNAKGIKCGAQCVTASIVTTVSTPDNATTRTINFNVIDNNSTP